MKATPKTPPKFDAFVRKVLAYKPPKDSKVKDTTGVRGSTARADTPTQR